MERIGGFEPRAIWLEAKHSTNTVQLNPHNLFGSLGWGRTTDLLIIGQVLYQLSYETLEPPVGNAPTSPAYKAGHHLGKCLRGILFIYIVCS